MKVLIACEFSGAVRRAFRVLNHDAWSCDLQPAEDNDPHHFQCDVGRLLHYPWDILIAHPPCTYLCNSGVRWLDTQPGRRDLMRDACVFFLKLQRCNIPRIAIENPIPHRHAKQRIGNYSQIIQPWQFGHGETKATCLWLKNLPLLKPTNIVEGRIARVHRTPPSPDRWKERSRTLPGIAAAMAAQWNNL